MPEHSPAEYIDMSVRITPTAVYIGDEQIPGCIAEGGITIKPGSGTDINRMTIEFLVGEVITEDVHSQQLTVPAETITEYSSKPYHA